MLGRMPLNALENGLVVPILGLLVERPLHPYELTAKLSQRYPHLSARRSSVTTLMKTLAQSGLIHPRAVERVGGRPARTVYEPTPAGIESLRARVETQLRDGTPASADFVTALAYIGLLSAVEARLLLAERARRAEAQAAALPPVAADEHEVHMIEVSYWRAILDAERAWMATVAERLATTTIQWPQP
jgi:DNA-binding PadR family transcriptional regulator